MRCWAARPRGQRGATGFYQDFRSGGVGINQCRNFLISAQEGNVATRLLVGVSPNFFRKNSKSRLAREPLDAVGGCPAPSPSALSRKVPRGALGSLCQAPTRGARRPGDPLITSGEWLRPRPSSSINQSINPNQQRGARAREHDVPINRKRRSAPCLRRASCRLHDPWQSHGCLAAASGRGRS